MSEAEKLAVVIEVLLDTADASRVLNVPEGTLKNWRSQGKGPDYVVVGGGGGRTRALYASRVGRARRGGDAARRARFRQGTPPAEPQDATQSHFRTA